MLNRHAAVVEDPKQLRRLFMLCSMALQVWSPLAVL